MIDQQKLELFPREIYLLEQFLSYDYYYETVKLCEELIQYAEEFYLKGGGIQIVLDPNDTVEITTSNNWPTPTDKGLKWREKIKNNGAK